MPDLYGPSHKTLEKSQDTEGEIKDAGKIKTSQLTGKA